MENTGNILLIGNSGAGKSTLINAVIGSEEAYTSIGSEGTTKEIRVYPDENSVVPYNTKQAPENNVFFRLIDTIGFESSYSKIRTAVNQVKKWSKNGTKDESDDRQLHLIWFCVDGTSGKLFPETIKNMLKATVLWKSVPIIVVITKSYSKPEREANILMVRAAFEKYSKNPSRLKAVIPVVAKTYVIDEDAGIFASPEGIETLIEISNALLPQGIQAAGNDIDAYNLKRKRVLAHGLTATATTAAAVVGAIPIPIADAALLTPLETGMLGGIARIYGIKSDDKSSVFMKVIVDTGTVSLAARALISALKAIPGINVGASVLNAVIAGAIVATIGEISVYAYEQVYLGNKTLNDIDWVKNTIEKALSSSDILKNAENVINTVGKEDDSKKIAQIIFKMFKSK